MTINKLSLDQPALYEITVPGKFEEGFLDWNGGLKITLHTHLTDNPTTIMAIKLDQAGLQGFLRYLYSLGLPLISVICVDYKQELSILEKV